MDVRAQAPDGAMLMAARTVTCAQLRSIVQRDRRAADTPGGSRRPDLRHTPGTAVVPAARQRVRTQSTISSPRDTVVPRASADGTRR